MITNKTKKEYIKSKLSSNPKWALKALLLVYDKQTADEKLIADTKHHNSVGFSGAHAEILSSFAQQYRSRGTLSDKQMKCVFKIMPRYWKQCLDNCNHNKLITNMVNDKVIDNGTALATLL